MFIGLIIVVLIALCSVIIGIVGAPSKNPLFVGFIGSPTQQINLRYNPLQVCTNYVFPNLEPDDVIHITNFTTTQQDWQVGHGPVGPSQEAKYAGTLNPGITTTYTTVLGDGVVSINFGNCV